MNGEDTYVLRAGVGRARRMIVNIPHAGTLVPDDIARDFASPEIAALPMTDWHVDQLYGFLPELGVDTLAARYSRFVVDLNRPPVAQALYPGRFETSVVATETFTGEPIYASPPSKAEIVRRRQLYYEPYHARLLRLSEDKLERLGGGELVLIDAHSIASGANRVHGPLTDHVYLGDRDGTTCPSWLTDAAEARFAEHGLRVTRNAPYKGGYITAHYGGFDNVHALQIEMCQRVYMDEASPEGAPARAPFARMQGVLRAVFDALLELIEERLG